MPSYSLNDPVFVHRDGGEKLEGVVAFLGKVAFSEGDDWVGIRLTGRHAGRGKNDGQVKNQRYFKCPPGSGIFVRQAALEARKLTKLEQLRLRRELASQGGASSAASSSATPPSSSKPSATAASTAGRQSRLDELRQRRAAISSDRETTSQEAISRAVEALNDKLKAKDAELESTKVKLVTVEKELTAAKEEIEKTGTDIKELQEKLKAASTATQSVTASSSGTDEGGEAQPDPQIWAREKQVLEDQVMQFEERIQTLTKQMDKQKSEHATEITQLRSESLAYKNELQNLSDQARQKGVSDTSHYKEKAQLQAQIAALRREVQDLKNEKIEIESTLEDLALDKEQLQEENEGLNEKLEEVKLDAETAQMEVEELRMELEETKEAAERVGSSHETNATAVSSNGETSTQSDDMAQALSIQNARLREALIRLREQSSIEKMELTRQLKAVEKEAEVAKGQVKQSTDLENHKSKLEEEIRDLKDMIDQGAAFEGMVEDLSDRLMEMEEQNVSLSTTIRELEEAAELTTEMEEVQAEELKAMTRDLEDRDTVIRNLEEAIKIQRKREEDFSRTVGNYRSTVETLKKEKEALMELQQGGEGEKSNLLASSQKALARAAQLVSDAADTRKREALAALDKIEGQAQKHLSERLEKMLPKGIVASELAAVKGELLVSRIAGLAAGSLDGIASSFNNNMRGVLLDTEATVGVDDNNAHIVLSDESKQDVANMMHQSECAHVLIETGSDAIRLLAAGQWPDLMSEQASADLGGLMGLTMPEVEVMLRALLKSLKEEGVIDTHQSHVDALRQVSKTVKHEFESDLYNRPGKASLPKDWKPPGMELFKHATKVKFSCLGAASAVAVSCRNETSTGGVVVHLKRLLGKLDTLSSEANQVCLRLASLNLQNTSDISTLSVGTGNLCAACDALLETIGNVLLEGDGISMDEVKASDVAVDAAAKLMSQVASVLRAAKLNNQENGVFHPLSPEAQDSWDSLSRLARKIRAIDGDSEDTNFLMRARSIEHRMADAVANEPKLSLANSKVSNLEKSLATRSKEIAMQNARLSELEKLLTKSSAKPSPVKISSVVKSSEELNGLKEENRVLMEAMDVLQEQVAGYENEIRMLNSMKSPKRSGSGKPDPRRKSIDVKSLGAMGKRQQSVANLGSDAASLAQVGVLEAALFRPALSDAIKNAAKWKNAALSKALQELPALSAPGRVDATPGNKEVLFGDALDILSQLSSAISAFRIEHASIQVVDLGRSCARARTQLRSSDAGRAFAREKLESAAAPVRRYLAQCGTSSLGASADNLLGKLKLQGREPYQTFPATVSTDELLRMNFHIVH